MKSQIGRERAPIAGRRIPDDEIADAVHREVRALRFADRIADVFSDHDHAFVKNIFCRVRRTVVIKIGFSVTRKILESAVNELSSVIGARKISAAVVFINRVKILVAFDNVRLIVAAELGGVVEVLPLEKIAESITTRIRTAAATPSSR